MRTVDAAWMMNSTATRSTRRVRPSKDSFAQFQRYRTFRSVSTIKCRKHHKMLRRGRGLFILRVTKTKQGVINADTFLERPAANGLAWHTSPVIIPRWRQEKGRTHNLDFDRRLSVRFSRRAKVSDTMIERAATTMRR